jgi:hypothetical protein
MAGDAATSARLAAAAANGNFRITDDECRVVHLFMIEFSFFAINSTLPPIAKTPRIAENFFPV